MKIINIAFTLLVAFVVAPFALAATSSSQDNHVTLTVTRYDDHMTIDCVPVTAETSNHQSWKTICNELADPQVSKLVADGTITSFTGPVFDLSAGKESTNKLSTNIPLSTSN